MLYPAQENLPCERDADVSAWSVQWPWDHGTCRTHTTLRRLEHPLLQFLLPAERGVAVFYADYFEGRPTAYGETYRADRLTAAHQTHPLGTLLKVTRLDTRRSVIVRVNDRGVHCDGCVIQLSKVAACVD